jgi:hypothetical protein
MAKRVAAKGKPKRRKRETNAERSTREKERLATYRAAGDVAMIMELEIEKLSAGKGDKRWGTKLSVGSAEEFCDGEIRVFTHRGERAYNAIGRLVCEYHENPPKFLRTIATFLEGKEPYSPGSDWYDGTIRKAYNEACFRFCSQEGYGVTRWPTFYEFFEVFLNEFEKKKKLKELKPPSERSLRRSLNRLALLTFPDKRGRPKRK